MKMYWGVEVNLLFCKIIIYVIKKFQNNNNKTEVNGEIRRRVNFVNAPHYIYIYDCYHLSYIHTL
jgi:hypothetical protein